MADILAGKNVFITGAGANIGRAIALEMAAEGASIYFAEIDPERCEALVAELQNLGVRVTGFICDISLGSAVEDVVAKLAAHEIQIDILVNNVGIHTKSREVNSETFERWRKVMDTNVLAPLYLSRLLAKTMTDNGVEGNILFITSMHQWVFHGDTPYSASKAALGMVIEELALHLAPQNIRVNGIAPGYTLLTSKGETIPHPASPLRGSSVEPRHIGKAAVFLASNFHSRFTTGSILKIDGGETLVNYQSREIMNPPLFPKANGKVKRAKQFLGKVSEKLFS